MRGLWSLVAVVVVQSCTPAGAPEVTLQARATSLVNDGRSVFIDVENTGVAGALRFSSTLGLVTPLTATIDALGTVTVQYACDRATYHDCLGQAVISADAVGTGELHHVASTSVQVIDRAPGFRDGGCADTVTQLGPLNTCCWEPGGPLGAPQCGWIAEAGNVDFALPLHQPSGDLVYAVFDFAVPQHWVDPATCATLHPRVTAMLPMMPTGAQVQLTCGGYGLDLASGGWTLLSWGPCRVGDDFFATYVCPELVDFAAVAFVLSNPSIPGAFEPDAGDTVFTVMPR